MNRALWLLPLLVALSACRKDAKENASTKDAAPPPERIAVVDPEEEKSSLANARVDEVKLAYEQLVAGKSADAYAAMRKLGSPRAVEPKELVPRITVAGPDRALLDSIRPCEREVASEDVCEGERDLARSAKCEARTLKSACTTTVLDVEHGKVLGAYPPYQIAARGKWIVHLAGGRGTVLDRDLRPVVSTASAHDVVPIDDTHLVHVDRPLRGPTAEEDTRAVRVLDLATRESTKGCALTGKNLTSRPVGSAGLAANGTTLVFQLSMRDGNAVILCELASGKTLGQWKPSGDDAWLLDDTGKTLFVTDIVIDVPRVGHPSNDYAAVAVLEHLAINAATGEVIGRARTESRSGPRRIAFVPNGDLLVITNGSQTTMLGTKPLRSPPGPPPKAGYAPLGFPGMPDSGSEIRAFANGTFLVLEGAVPPYGVPSRRRATSWRTRLYSAKTRSVLWEGSTRTIFEDKPNKTAGWIARAKTPADGPTVVVVDANGVVKTRPLPPDFDAGFPPELAGMVSTPEPPTEEEIAEKLAPNLCAIGGLFVPRAICPADLPQAPKRDD